MMVQNSLSFLKECLRSDVNEARVRLSYAGFTRENQWLRRTDMKAGKVNILTFISFFSVWTTT